MNNDVLLEMMASVLQSIYDEGYGSEFRPAMQNVLVAFNNRGLTPRALDVCNCAEFNGVGFNNDGFAVCLRCGGKRK